MDEATEFIVFYFSAIFFILFLMLFFQRYYEPFLELSRRSQLRSEAVVMPEPPRAVEVISDNISAYCIVVPDAIVVD